MKGNIITLLFITVLTVTFLNSCEETDFQDLYRPRKVGDTRTYKCKKMPGSEGYEWNTVSEYTQTWNGSVWEPADDPDTEYNEYGTEITCQFKCAMGYAWDYIGSCIIDTNSLYRTYYCQPKPEGEAYEWNTVSQYTQKSTDQGATYYPSDDPVTEYNESPSTTSCQYKCAAGYMWNGSICTAAATDVKTYICNPLPSENGEYIWNTVDRFNQESFDDGNTWTPPDDPTTEYNEEPSTTSCRFKCNTGYSWNGSGCVYMSWESAAGYQWLKSSTPMTYEDANTFCSNNGGYIPAIDQLKQLLQNCAKTAYGGTCTATNSCVSWSSCRNTDCEGCTMQSSGYYSVFNDSSWFWSSTQLSDQVYSVYTLNFDTAAINMSTNNETYTGNVRCIK